MAPKPKNHEPMFHFGEKVPAYLAGVFIVIHVAIYFVSESVGAYLELYAVLQPLRASGTHALSSAFSLVGHSFLHGSWSHVLMNSGMIIIFGIATIRGMKFRKSRKGLSANPNLSFLMLFFAGVIVGGIFQWGWWSASGDMTSAAIGASGGASALFATTGWAIGGRDKMLQFGFGWVIINIIMVFAEPILGVSLAWAAHIGGYIGGMLLAPLLVKPNSTKLGLT